MTPKVNLDTALATFAEHWARSDDQEQRGSQVAEQRGEVEHGPVEV
jgi:hypothetical protein